MRRLCLAYFSFAFFMFFLNFSVQAEEVTIEFHYDELGRLTFVKDSVNGSRDYDHDPAGNRTQVVIGPNTDGEDPVPSLDMVPLAPTNALTYQNHAPGVYTSKWGSVERATYYRYRTVAEVEYVVQQLSVTYNSKGKWVRACNDHGCGVKTYFK